MTDAQTLTIALAIIIPLSLLIYSNSRITEAKETLRAESQTLRTEMKAGLDRIEAKLDRIAETLSTMLNDHEQRLRGIEHRPH
jgi:hypothetical protein